MGLAKFKVTCTYADGTERSMETDDDAAAAREAGSMSWEEDKAKTVTLTKDGEAVYSIKVKAYKPIRLG
jgi:hypothetical protein